MANIETCLNCLNDIDEQTLYAEGMVLSSHIMWSDKVSMVLEALQSSADTEDCEEFIQEAKSVGTGITISKGDSLLKRVWDFIRRLVRSIINKISDVLTKLKIRNYEYIEIPMDKSLVEKDLDSIDDIVSKFMTDMLNKLFSNHDENVKPDTNIINELIQQVSTLNIVKGVDDGKRHGVKPDEFMTLRDKIRKIDKENREFLKRTDVYAKKLESDINNGKNNGNKIEYIKSIQKLMTDVSNATTKLFTSFKFGGIDTSKKMTEESTDKVNDTQKKLTDLKQQQDAENAELGGDPLKNEPRPTMSDGDLRKMRQRALHDQFDDLSEAQSDERREEIYRFIEDKFKMNRDEINKRYNAYMKNKK